MKKREKRTVKKNNKGFSFIELLLAIVILALVAAPIFRVFITTSQINNNSKQLMAATDAATVTMEYISACKFSGTDGIEAIFTDTSGIKTRIPALSFACHSQLSGSSATNYSDFVSHAEGGGMVVGTGDQYVFYLKPAGTNSLGLALFNVPSNGYKFDMIVWFEPRGNTSDKYYTYDVTIDVYEDEEVQVNASDGSVSTQYRNFGTKLISINGAVENQ